MNLPSPQHYTVSERIELLAPHIRPSIHPPSRITFSFTSTHFLHLHACLDLSHLSAIFGTRCLILAIISISRRFIPSPPSRLLSRLGLINLLEHFERRRRNQTESLDYLIRFAHFSLSILITFLHDARFFFSPPFFIFISIFLVSCLLSPLFACHQANVAHCFSPPPSVHFRVECLYAVLRRTSRFLFLYFSLLLFDLFAPLPSPVFTVD